MEEIWIVYICIIASAILVVLYLYSFRYEPFNFKLSDIDILIRDSSKFAGERSGKPILSILHLSDFHLRQDRKGKKIFEFVRNLKSFNVDFILITGDMVGDNKNIEYLIKMLSLLRAKYGKYAVLGVHDHYNKTVLEFLKNMFKRKRRYKKENDVASLTRRLGSIGIEVLVNKAKKVNINGDIVHTVEIIGLDDPIIRKTDVAKAFSHLTSGKGLRLNEESDYRKDYKDTFRLKKDKIHKLDKDGVLRITLLHTPDSNSIVDIVRNGTDIIFSGHTHGGQVRFPLIGAVISGCKIKTKFASGLFYFNKFVLYVSRGLGEGKYSPCRFYCQPEASLVRIYGVK